MSPVQPSPAEPVTVEAVTPDETTQGRQCARCRNTFPIEPDTHPMELLGWWTCPSCTRSLLPARHRSTTATTTSDVG